MNTTSDVAFEIAQDIYKLCGKVDSLFEQYGNHQIGANVFYKKLYICACEASYLEGVISEVKNEGYKFVRYQKELNILNLTIEAINNSLKIINVESLENCDIKSLMQLTEKYKKYVCVDDISEEF